MPSGLKEVEAGEGAAAQTGPGAYGAGSGVPSEALLLGEGAPTLGDGPEIPADGDLGGGAGVERDTISQRMSNGECQTCRRRAHPGDVRNPLRRLTSRVDAVGTTKCSYTAGNQVQTEDGPFAGDTVSNTYVNRLRVGLSLRQLAGVRTKGFASDAARRRLTSGMEAVNTQLDVPA